MTATDESDFTDYLSNRGDTLAVSGRPFSLPDPEYLDLSSDVLPPVKYITLLHSEVSQPPSRHDDGTYMHHLFRDAFIEFSRCQRGNEVMVSGRICAKVGWLEDAEANKVYRSWYRSIERLIKKRYTRVRHEWWVGPDAQSWSRDGGQFALGSTLALHVSLADDQAE